ncbi:MAG: hypothetical protein ACRDN9_13515 [Streptosporangiaceae bacterium]
MHARCLRPLVAAVAVLLGAVACGSGDAGTHRSDGQRTRTVHHAMGTAEVPLHPQRRRRSLTDAGDTDRGTYP